MPGASGDQADEPSFLRARVADLESQLTRAAIRLHAVTQSEATYRAIIERQTELVCEWLPDTTLTFVNVAYCDFFGRERDELIGKSFLALVPEAFRPGVRVGLRELCRNPGVEVREHAVNLANGDIGWQQWVNRPIYDAVGNLEGFQSVGRDITERKKIELELREREALLRQMAESMHEVFWLVDATTKAVLYVSPAYARVWGRTVASRYEDPMGWASDIHPEDKRRVLAAYDEAVSAGRYEQEFRITRQDGAVRWISERAVPVLDDAGRVYRLAGISEDVTERREAEAAVSRTRDRLVHLMKTQLVGIAFGNLGGELYDGNDAYFDIIGYSREECVAQRIPWTQITPPEFDDGWRRAYAQIVARGYCDPFEKAYVRKDGSRVPVLVGIARLPGPKEDAVALVFDLTDQKRAEAERGRLEAQLRQSQKMDALGRLAGGVAHDFNNLLTVVLGNSGKLVRALQEATVVPDVSWVLTGLRQVHAAGERAARLTRQLLTFGQRQASNLQPVDLRKILAEMAELVRHVVGKRIEVQFVSCEAPGCVLGDATLFEQAVMNLVLNARDAMPEGGTLTIEIGSATANSSDETGPALAGPFTTLVVSDTGVGMDEETQARMFEPFFTTKPFGQGTGLGLAVVYGVVNELGGFIRVESQPGKGSQFCLYLPVASDTAQNGELNSTNSSSSDSADAART